MAAVVEEAVRTVAAPAAADTHPAPDTPALARTQLHQRPQAAIPPIQMVAVTGGIRSTVIPPAKQQEVARIQPQPKIPTPREP